MGSESGLRQSLIIVGFSIPMCPYCVYAYYVFSLKNIDFQFGITNNKVSNWKTSLY